MKYLTVNAFVYHKAHDYEPILFVQFIDMHWSYTAAVTTGVWHQTLTDNTGGGFIENLGMDLGLRPLYKVDPDFLL